VKIAIVAAEITPWAKAGGLADVIGALPAALKQSGAEPVVILPGYRGILDALKTTPVAENLSVPVGNSAERFDLLRADTRDGVPLYLLFPGGARPPEVLPQILTPGTVLAALDRAGD